MIVLHRDAMLEYANNIVKKLNFNKHMILFHPIFLKKILQYVIIF